MGRESPPQPPEVIDARELLGEMRTLTARIIAIVDVLETDLDREHTDEQL